MQVLTREQAIKRIKDIRELKQIDHMRDICDWAPEQDMLPKAVIAELMAIFDIKEEELK